MSDETLLLLRLLVGGALYAFMGALLYFVWRDYRAAVHPPAAQPALRGRLVVVQAGDVVLTRNDYPLLPLTTIGRAPTNAIVLPDVFASSEHAALTLRDGRWWLEDRRSANGTTLNDRPVEEATVVAAGDIIGVGRVQFRVEFDVI
ncbi:MAG: FHA domain-containing protein [Anaerolineae bacterium]|nr:FHA domain-containing protein [Anaerolineae bacterium]